MANVKTVENTPENGIRNVQPISLTDKDNGESWTFDFNRAAIKRITEKPELVKALDMTEELGAGTRLAMWGLYMPEIMAIATMMNHIPAMGLKKAQDLYSRLPKRAEFGMRLAEIFLARVSEINGYGNEDVVETDAGNVSWE